MKDPKNVLIVILSALVLILCFKYYEELHKPKDHSEYQQKIQILEEEKANYARINVALKDSVYDLQHRKAQVKREYITVRERIKELPDSLKWVLLKQNYGSDSLPALLDTLNLTKEDLKQALQQLALSDTIISRQEAIISNDSIQLLNADTIIALTKSEAQAQGKKANKFKLQRDAIAGISGAIILFLLIK